MQKKLGFVSVPVLPPQISIDPPLGQVADPEVIEHDEDHDEIALNWDHTSSTVTQLP